MQDGGSARPSRPAARPGRRPVLPGGCVLLCLTDARDAGRLGALLRQAGATGVAVAPERLDLAFAMREATRYAAAIIDLDALGDPDRTMDLCLILRRAAPALPIVVLASDTGSADPLALRLGLCHAELARNFTADDAVRALMVAARRARMVPRGS
jgi:DNA-binding NarL/FixJ family response regulator